MINICYFRLHQLIHKGACVTYEESSSCIATNFLRFSANRAAVSKFSTFILIYSNS